MFNLPNRFNSNVIFDSNEFQWEANLKGEYTYVSSDVKKILGYTSKELVGKTPFMMMPQHHSIKNKKIFSIYQKKPKSFREYPSKRIHKNGNIVYIETSGEPIFEDSCLVGYKGYSKDITQKIKYQKAIDNTYKQLKKINKHLKTKIEKEVRKNKEKDEQLFAQSKLAAMGDMIGNIGHQWRQPLNIISTTASSIKINQELNQYDVKSLAKDMDVIMEQTLYLSKTIDTFMNFIKEKKEYKEVNIKQTIESTIKIVRKSLENNFIDLTHNLQTVKDICLYTIQAELQEVLINIISNAKDAIIQTNGKNGAIILNVYPSKNRVTITIEDNGGGIDEKSLPRIFEPYFTTKHQSQGTGLGLHMSYRIITQSLHGEIYAINANKGAKFFIHLPIRKR